MANVLDSVSKTTTKGKSVVRDIDPKDAIVGVVSGKTKKDVKVKDAVVNFVKFSLLEKSYKGQKEEMSEVVRDYASKVRLDNADQGDYQKSYRVLGGVSKEKVEYGATCSSQDRFRIPKDDLIMDTVKELIGVDIFDKLFSKEITISIREDVLKNKAKKKELTQKLIKAFGKDLSDWFVKDETWATNEKADETVYELDSKVRAEFLELVPQYKDSVKNSSVKIK